MEGVDDITWKFLVISTPTSFALPVTGWQSNELSLCSVAGKLLKNSVTFAEPPFTRFPFQTIVVFSEYNFDMSYKEYKNKNYKIRPSHLQSDKI